MEKFQDPVTTANGQKRAWVSPKRLTTLWFNTGTLCNLACQNCYIESSPTNDSLVYITSNDVISFLDEIESSFTEKPEIGFTGGEPFLNPYFISILKICLSRGYKVLVLTNAMKPMLKCAADLQKLQKSYSTLLTFRVSMDHYTQEVHEKERGPRSWHVMLEGIEYLLSQGMSVFIAGRLLTQETYDQVQAGYLQLFRQNQWPMQAQHLVLFAEMDSQKVVPEITEGCWKILDKSPDDMMCASSRMIVKRKGKDHAEVIACTLLPYEQGFSMGNTLKDSWKGISLNHPHCATFCVLGGSSCS